MHNIANHRPRRIAKHTVYAVSGLALTLCMPVSAAPKVVASLMPIQSLIAGVMGDAGTPAVIIQGYGSPHVYSLRPSEAATLSNADIVFWIGRSMETFLQKPLSTLARKAQVVALLDTEGLILLPNREAGVWEVDYHGEQG
ncbi:MAG: zinc ABC transporter substrate-binding protein, partial [Acidiferrobacterales bacterium]